MESLNRKLRQLSFVGLDTWSNFRRSGWMSWIVVSTMVVALSVLGGFWLMINDLNTLTKSVGSQMEVTAFLKDGTPLETYVNEAKGIPGVTEVNLVTKEEAWSSLQSDLKNEMSFESMNDENPLPDAVRVSVASAEQVASVADRLKAMENTEEVSYGYALVERLQEVTQVIRLIGLVITVILGIATVAIIVNTIHLAVSSRQNEIEIMRLVGASHWFIRIPFILEGVVFGLLSSLLTSGVLAVWRVFSLQQAQGLFSFISVIGSDFGAVWRISFWLLPIGISLGILGAALSTHRYLRLEKTE